MKTMNLKVGQLRRSINRKRYAFIVSIDSRNEWMEYYYLDKPDVIHRDTYFTFGCQFL